MFPLITFLGRPLYTGNSTSNSHSLCEVALVGLLGEHVCSLIHCTLKEMSDRQRKNAEVALNNPPDSYEETSTLSSQSLRVRTPTEGFLGAFGPFGGQ